MDLVEQMIASDNPILKAAANDMKLFKGLKHDKEGLETVLKHTISHIRFRPKNHATFTDIACSSNTRFISVFQQLKESQKKKALLTKPDGIHTKEPDSILTFNLISNKYNTVSLDRWEIVSFIVIQEENIELLDRIANELLKRKIDKDLSDNKAK